MIPTLRAVIDCDPGVDDTMALFYGLLSPTVEIVGISTVWGNTRVETCTQNALRLLEIVGRTHVPVAMGAPKPLVGPMPALGEGIHGADGQGNTNLPPPTLKAASESGADLIVRLAHERPGELTLVAVGPMTNLGIALGQDPSIAKLYKNVVLMGGAFLHPGNVSRFGEANIWHDPEAAQMVFEAPWSVTAVGLDVTHTVRLTQSMADQLRDTGTPAGVHLHRISDHYITGYARRWGRRESAMHDALALGIAEDPTIALKAPTVRVDVELHGTFTRGMTVGDFRPRPPGETVAEARTTVVLEVDGPRFIQRWLDVLSKQ